jgi:hypothetical protein
VGGGGSYCVRRWVWVCWKREKYIIFSLETRKKQTSRRFMPRLKSVLQKQSNESMLEISWPRPCKELSLFGCLFVKMEITNGI